MQTILALMLQSLIAVPGPVRAMLDDACPSWRLARVMPEIFDEIRNRTPSWPPNLIPGDFDANGLVDVAVLVECGESVELLAFLASASGFNKHVIEPSQAVDPRQFVHLIQEEYGRDAIGVEYLAIGGHAWVYRDGAWRSIPR
jgi:hypothetical protein